MIVVSTNSGLASHFLKLFQRPVRSNLLHLPISWELGDPTHLKLLHIPKPQGSQLHTLFGRTGSGRPHHSDRPANLGPYTREERTAYSRLPCRPDLPISKSIECIDLLLWGEGSEFTLGESESERRSSGQN